VHEAAGDIRDTFIQRLAAERTFVDVGGLWGVVNEKVSVAARAGASSVTMIDVTPSNSPSWKALSERLESLGCADCTLISASIDEAQVLEDVGPFDIVHCSGVLYHAPNPLHMLTRLRALCRYSLILTSVVIPQRITTDQGELVVGNGQLLFVPHLPSPERRLLSAFFQAAGVEDAVGIHSGVRHWKADGSAASDYAPWWWLFTRQALHQLTAAAGFRSIDAGDAWEGRAYCLLLQPR
jgi:hypothetical protein